MSDFDRKEYHTVVLAALLHDIGKFMQRAEVQLGDTSRQMESTLCPVNKGIYSHKHVLWTDYFFESCVRLPAGFSKSEIGRLSAIHHRPDSALAEIITVADRLSSGMDRDSMRQDEEAGRDAYKKMRLRPVFESLELDLPVKGAVYRYELKPLNDPVDVFPRAQAELNPPEGESLVRSYRVLWDEFAVQVGNLATDDFHVFYCGLNQLLQQYTWCISSSTMDYPDVSLYDHVKTTAAIAACLYRYHAPLLDQKDVRDYDAEKFVLVVGDLSGIQDYLFNIKHIGAGGSAKRLRARSFTVSLMTEITVQRFIRLFELWEPNVLMSSGGKFYLLLPNLPDTDEKIERLEGEIRSWLYENLNAEIGINIATLKLAGKDFSAFQKVFSEINARLQQKKLVPFSSVLSGPSGWSDAFILDHAVFGEEEKLCKGCGRLPGSRIEDDKHFCGWCEQDKDIGAQLPKADYTALYDDEKRSLFKLLGHSFEFVKDLKDISGRPYLILSLAQWATNNRLPVSRRFLAQHIPVLAVEDCSDCDCDEKDEVKAGQPMMFQCIARKSEGKRIVAYLKADVDRLGELFAHGFKGVTKSVSRLATMSRMLDLFFSGYIEKLLTHKENRHIYTVYSGGDDLLLIGPWNKTIHFAKKVQEEFTRFICYNPNLTLSAGVILAKPRMPVFRSVEMADMAIEEAKETPKDAGRDQVWLFGECVKWNQVDQVLDHAQQLSSWIEKKTISVGFGRNLLTYGWMRKEFEKTGKTDYLRYLPLMTYDIARNIGLSKQDVRQWAEGLKEPGSLAMKHMGIIANYALTANRGGGDER